MSTIDELIAILSELTTADDAEAFVLAHKRDIAGMNGDTAKVWAHLDKAGVTVQKMEALQHGIAELARAMRTIGEGKHDLGNAEFALKSNPGKFAYSDSLGWLYWTGTHWSRDTAEARVHDAMTTALRTRCALALEGNDLETLRAATPSARHTRDAIYHFRYMVTAATRSFDNEAHLLNTLSGIVDLRTGKLTTHDASKHFTYCVPVEYKPRATSELWDKLIRDWFDGDEEAMQYLQRAMGYTITGENREECMFFVHGPGRSGKGTLVNCIAELLGEPVATGVDFKAFTGDGDTQNFLIAPLRNARMVTASENKRGQRLNERLIKSVTGRDTIQAAHKYGAPFTFRPQFKLWLMSNDPPRGDVDDDAFWHRVRLFTLAKSHMGAEDVTIKDTLRQPEHAEAILAWLVTGAIRYYESGLGEPIAMSHKTQGIREEQDPVHQWILDRCELVEGIETSTTELYGSYSDWCADNGIEKAKLPKMGLTQRLAKKGYTSRRTSLNGMQIRYVSGLVLRA